MIDRIRVPAQPTTTITNTVHRENNERITSEPVQSEKLEENKIDTITKEKLEKIVDGMNEFVSASNTHLKFEFHDKLNEYYVTIVDDKTQEVVKEIPSKKMLDLYAAMTEFLGIMVDKKI